ncbi:MAG: sigma 54-interacting transcriptional regulator, partial [Desulfobacterales bacterium]
PMGPQSLKVKLLLAVSGLVIGSGLIISMLVTRNYSKSLKESMTAEAEHLAHMVALEATDKILINDLVALQKSLDHHLHSSPSIAYIFILKDRQVLAHTFSGGIPSELIGANNITQNDAGHFKKIVSTDGEHFLDIAWPVFSGKAGILRLGLSEKPYRHQVNRLWFQMAAITFAIFLLAIAVSLLFIKRMINPLTTLAAAVEKIDEGNLDERIETKGNDEVGRLAFAFTRMVSRIKKYTRRLEEKAEELNRAHRQTRTSFIIAREIGALPNLKDVCHYLIKKLREIVTCEKMLILVFNTRKKCLFSHTDKESKILNNEAAAQAADFLNRLDSMQVFEKVSTDLSFLPQSFHATEKMAVFPIRHEKQLLGAMVISCPDNCNCVRKELDVIELIINQTSGVIQRSAVYEGEIQELKTRTEKSAEFCGIIGKNPQMQVVYKLIMDIANTDSTVLIQGESGTGKELVARALHRQSPRKDKPFVVINCSAYSPTLLESELFGHEKGAFTGAGRKKPGRFEQADSGTVFLDEIGEIDPSAQIKLLRVLQSKKFERIGGEETLTVDVRILAATNKDLIQEVKTGKFREDLFYRLNVIPIQLPPLRNRRNDLPLLARHFLARFADEQGKNISEFSSEALRLLLDYNWPGNVRELENIIEHA